MYEGTLESLVDGLRASFPVEPMSQDIVPHGLEVRVSGDYVLIATPACFKRFFGPHYLEMNVEHHNRLPEYR